MFKSRSNWVFTLFEVGDAADESSVTLLDVERGELDPEGGLLAGLHGSCLGLDAVRGIRHIRDDGGRRGVGAVLRHGGPRAGSHGHRPSGGGGPRPGRRPCARLLTGVRPSERYGPRPQRRVVLHQHLPVIIHRHTAFVTHLESTIKQSKFIGGLCRVTLVVAFGFLPQKFGTVAGIYK